MVYDGDKYLKRHEQHYIFAESPMLPTLFGEERIGCGIKCEMGLLPKKVTIFFWCHRDATQCLTMH